MPTGKPLKVLPYPIYFFTVCGLALTGLLASVYLSFSHYRVYTDIGYRSFCAISRAINCDTVSQSPYAIFSGIPVPVWGVIGYGFLLAGLPLVAVKRLEQERGWALLFGIALLYSLYSVILAGISTFYIHSYCIVCIATYGVNFMLLWYTALIRRRFSARKLGADLKRDVLFAMQKRAAVLTLLAAVVVAVAALKLFLPAYWDFEPPRLSADIATGATNEGYPWIGAQNPKLTIMEFADYQCFQCKKMHYFLRDLIARYPGRIRLIHRHFPMDDKFNPIVKDPFHSGSGAMAILAEYAQSRGKFWQMNDALYRLAGRTNSIKIRELAENVGLDARGLGFSLENRAYRYRVKHDIAAGLKLGIRGTPGFVINGRVYLGYIPPEILKRALKD